MTAGFEVFNDQYVYQLDGRSKNLSLVAKGVTIPFGSSYYDNGGIGVPRPYYAYGANGMYASKSVFSSATPPVVFFRPLGASAALTGVHNEGGNSWAIYGLSNQPVNLQWWAFADSPGSGGHGFGLEVFDETGAVVYYSGYGALKIRGLWPAVNGPSPYYGNNLAFYVSSPNTIEIAGAIANSEVGFIGPGPNDAASGSVNLTYTRCYTDFPDPSQTAALAETTRRSLIVLTADVSGL